MDQLPATAITVTVRNEDMGTVLPPLRRLLDQLDAAGAGERFALFGLADPAALRVALAAKEAVDFIGLPEGSLALAQSAIFLATAPKSAPAKSAVEIALAREPDGFLALTVRDRGPGLPVAGRERLFDLFAQGPEGASEGGKGYGIGLYVVREWTRAMGGTVTVDDPPGGGARFRCRFPRWQEEPSWLQAS